MTGHFLQYSVTEFTVPDLYEFVRVARLVPEQNIGFTATDWTDVDMCPAMEHDRLVDTFAYLSE